MPKLWPITCKRATVASSMINTWEKLLEQSSEVPITYLVLLAFYRTESQYKPKLDPNASPAPMAGWKVEFGLRFKPLLDYQALREGKIVCVQEPDQMEIYRNNARRV